MKFSRPTATAVLAAALLLSGACGAGDDQGGSAPRSDDAELIEYSKDPAESPGVTIEKATDVDELEGAPADFKQFVVGSMATVSMFDQKCPLSVSVAKIDTSGFARGSMFSCGGADFIWAKRDGLWQEIWGGQDTPRCDELEKYAVPQAIAGDTCFDGEKDVDYTG